MRYPLTAWRISDRENEYGQKTPYLRFYFTPLHDHHEYVLYIDKESLTPYTIHRCLTEDIPLYCVRCDRLHHEICPRLNLLEVKEEIYQFFLQHYQSE